MLCPQRQHLTVTGVTTDARIVSRKRMTVLSFGEVRSQCHSHCVQCLFPLVPYFSSSSHLPTGRQQTNRYSSWSVSSRQRSDGWGPRVHCRPFFFDPKRLDAWGPRGHFKAIIWASPSTNPVPSPGICATRPLRTAAQTFQNVECLHDRATGVGDRLGRFRDVEIGGI